MEAYKSLILLQAFITSCESWCPLDSRVEQGDRGCDQCTCCRFRSGEYLVLCESRGLTSIPDIPTHVTYLDLTNNSITRLDDKSFPHLPHLKTLLLSPSRLPLIKITARALQQLPNLGNLSLDINLDHEVEDFLSSTRVDELKVNCSQKMTQAKFKTMIGKRSLEKLTVYNCPDLLLDGRSYENPPKSIFFHFVNQNLPGSLYVKLPQSEVEVYFHPKVEIPKICFNVTDVSARTFLISCRTEYLRIEDPHLLDWVDRTNARVSLKIFYNFDYYKPDRIQLGNHSFYSLEITLKGNTLVLYNKTIWHQLITDLLHSMETSSVERFHAFLPVFLYYQDIPSLGVDFLQRLIHQKMQEVELEGFPIGNIDGLDVNLSKFVCNRCQVTCYTPFTCMKKVPIRQMMLQNADTKTLYLLPQFLMNHPDLEILTLKSQYLDVQSLDLPYHEKLTVLELMSTVSTIIPSKWPTSALNISALVNLQHLVIQNMKLGHTLDMVVNKNFSIAYLHKLVSLDFTDVTISRLEGDLGNLLQGCNSLAQLRLKRSNFWSTAERLVALLSPVSDTLEEVDLSENVIDHLPTDMFAGMQNLRRLDLSDNVLRVLDGCILSNTAVLSKVSLIGNRLSDVVGVSCLRKLQYLRIVELRNNLLTCTCENRQLRDWIRHDQWTRDISHDQQCPPSELQSTRVRFSNYSMPWIACDFHKEEVISGAALLALGLASLAIYAAYYYRYDFWFWWVVKRRHRFNRHHRIHPERRFHAFLSYSSSEQLIAEYMFEELEKGEDVRFKIAYDCRDFLPLYDIADNIIRCIDHSEKVIFLVSKRFLEREWCQFEINFAQMRCFDERKNLIILIFLEKFRADELPKRLRILRRQVNYLEYPDHADRRAVQNFWHRLRLALAQDSRLEVDEREPLLGPDRQDLAYTI